ncbi:hypothetical protein SteCoe_22761 [Stentor coeruleus]|uniref:Uncharacterized protein n=1 Tax=Stentor coeruleus TaxID=5963 RepID=A0A1R2BLN2_9CILI|nr:hypothetical protein SteCoe_22761 [Stentor coeruleus]
MKIRNRLLRLDFDILESSKWKRLSNIITEEKFTDFLKGVSKYYLEQKSESTSIFSSVKFSSLVEIIEYNPYRPNKSTKISELSLIVHSLKKDCGMIENVLKPSTNRYKIPEKLPSSPMKSVLSCLNVSRKIPYTPSLTTIPKTEKQIKFRTLTRALTFAKQEKINQIVPGKMKLEIRVRF